jgi:copper(I)-binding protein
MRNKTYILLRLMGMALLLAACAGPAASGPRIRVENAWARPAMVMGTVAETPEASGMSGMAGGNMGSAAYFTIVNDGAEADTLTGVKMSIAGKASLHETQTNAGVSKMVPVASLEIPAHGKVEFKPGSYHVMLEELQQELNEGDQFQLTLLFTKSGSVTLDVPVRQQP